MANLTQAQIDDILQQEMESNNRIYMQHHFKMPRSTVEIWQQVHGDFRFARLPQALRDACSRVPQTRGRAHVAGKRFMRALWKHLHHMGPVPAVPVLL